MSRRTIFNPYAYPLTERERTRNYTAKAWTRQGGNSGTSPDIYAWCLCVLVMRQQK